MPRARQGTVLSASTGCSSQHPRTRLGAFPSGKWMPRPALRSHQLLLPWFLQDAKCLCEKSRNTYPSSVTFTGDCSTFVCASVARGIAGIGLIGACHMPPVRCEGEARIPRASPKQPTLVTGRQLVAHGIGCQQ